MSCPFLGHLRFLAVNEREIAAQVTPVVGFSEPLLFGGASAPFCGVQRAGAFFNEKPPDSEAEGCRGKRTGGSDATRGGHQA